MRFRFVAFLVLALTVQGWRAEAQTAASDPNQQVFLSGVRALGAGDFAVAIAILEPLADRTGAPRVRLELARAFYLDNQLTRARSEFLKVYRRSDLPYAVRRTINVFLADIDQRAGYFEPSVGIEFNSNPGQIAAAGVYDIFGLPLQFEPQKHASSPGLSAGADFAAPLGASSLVGQVDGVVYRVPDVSWVSGSAAVRLPTSAHQGWYAVGASFYDRDRTDTVATAFLERNRRFSLGHGRQLTFHVMAGRQEVWPQRQLSGFTVEGDAAYAFDVGRNTAISATAVTSYASARYAVDRRWSGGLHLEAFQAVPRLDKNVIVDLGADVISYGDIDPLFGKLRRDLTSRADLAILNGAPIHGLFPGVRFTYERRDSTVAFYGYTRKAVSFELRRRF